MKVAFFRFFTRNLSTFSTRELMLLNKIGPLYAEEAHFRYVLVRFLCSNSHIVAF